MIPATKEAYPFVESSVTVSGAPLAQAIQRMTIFIYGCSDKNNKDSSDSESVSTSQYTQDWEVSIIHVSGMPTYAQLAITFNVPEFGFTPGYPYYVNIPFSSNGSITKMFKISQDNSDSSNSAPVVESIGGNPNDPLPGDDSGLSGTDPFDVFVYIALTVELEYIKKVATTALYDHPLILRPELVHIRPYRELYIRSCHMEFNGEDRGHFTKKLTGDIELRSGNNVSIRLSDDGTIFIDAGAGLGSGSFNYTVYGNSDVRGIGHIIQPWSGGVDPYRGVCYINGLNDGGNINIRFSPQAVSLGAEIYELVNGVKKPL